MIVLEAEASAARDKMVDRVAVAIERAFKDRIARSASGPEPDRLVTFDQTGVSSPKFDLWQEYARAAVDAMEDTYEIPHKVV